MKRIIKKIKNFFIPIHDIKIDRDTLKDNDIVIITLLKNDKEVKKTAYASKVLNSEKISDTNKINLIY